MKQLLVMIIIMMGIHVMAKEIPPKASVLPKKPIEVNEDGYLLGALDAQARQKYDVAEKYWDVLYTQTGDKGALYSWVSMLEKTNNNAKLVEVTQKALVTYPDDLILHRFLVIGWLKGGQYPQAATKATWLTQQTKKGGDYALLGEALIKTQDFQGALAAFNHAYTTIHTDAIADRIALIMYLHLKQKKEAVAWLKAHIQNYGTSVLLGKRLGAMYADSGDLDSAALINEQTYNVTQDLSCAEEAIKIYAYQKKRDKVQNLLEKTSLNDPFLLELYIQSKQFDKGSALAKKLYQHDKNPEYLGQSAVLAYEASPNKKDPVLLREVIEGLKTVNAQMKSPLYQNYLGYLMIDHDMDIDGGIGYVKKALASESKSPFYLDSLAWGYYKKGECAKALLVIKEAKSLLENPEQEVDDHLKAIESCKSTKE
jgi:hypothetical protein